MFSVLMSNIEEMKEEDKLEILSFFYECSSSKLDVFDFLEKENFIFQKNKLKEKLFLLILDYFHCRTILRMDNDKTIFELEKKIHMYPQFLVFNLKKDKNIIDNIYLTQSLSQVANNGSVHFYADDMYDLYFISGIKMNMPTFFVHSGLSFRFCGKGSVKFTKNNLTLNNKETLISRGIYLENYQFLSEDTTYIYVHIKQDFLDKLNMELPKFMMDKLNWTVDPNLLEALIINKDHKFIHLLTLRFITDLLLKVTNMDTMVSFQRAPKKKQQDELLDDIKDYIDQNIENRILISEIQYKFGINKNNLIKIFNDRHNMGPSRYILNKKLETAAHLLLDSTLKVSEIVEKLSFPTSSSFSKFFKEKYSVTPLNFRKSMGEIRIKGKGFSAL
jgi:AraC-like DNA-binding protein